jgi:cytochrome c nitrite reductase small subunit
VVNPLPSHRAGLGLSVLLGIMLGLGYFTWSYAEGGSYFSNDPRACANCHVMRDYLNSWQKSSHKQVAMCNDCHTPHAFIPKYLAKAENGVRHSWKFSFQTYPERLQITQMNLDNLQGNCIGCHRDFVAEITRRTQHGFSPEQTCVHCHSDVGHGARY